MRISRRQFSASAIASIAGAVFAQEDTGLVIEHIASDFRFTEGPVWSREGFLLFSDIPNNRIMKFVPGEKPTVFRDDSNGANGNALDSQGRLYSCESHTRRVVRADKKGAIQVLADKWEGKQFNAPNDIAVRHDGHTFFTDPAFGVQNDTRELDFYGVYHIAPKGELRLAAKPVGRPNGVTFSPSGHILYVTNSDEHNVRAYDVDRNGDLSQERVLISGIDGVPDGIRADEKGNLYVAARRVWVYDPQGKLLANLDLPEKPSNCAFGDGDFRSLYITAGTGLYRARRDVKGAVQY